MPNLTVSLDEDLLDRAKDVARREHISLNRLVRDVLMQRVAAPDGERLSLRDWIAMADGAHVDPSPLPADGSRGWQRGDLYRTTPT
ncbi:MAG: DUF6364 family protein [Planctomycetota bacterium]